MSLHEKISEEDVKLRYITPAVEKAGWDKFTQIQMEYPFTDGMVLVKDGFVTRGKKKSADYLLSYKKNRPLAIIEAKHNWLSLGDGMQQGLSYAECLDVPFVYSSNGSGFLEHDRLTGLEKELSLDAFPGPEVLWRRYVLDKDLSPAEEKEITTPYYYELGGSIPRYYQRIAINKTIDAVSTGVYPGGIDKRILLVMATGTGKTFTAFQIVHRLRESGLAKRILYLADRNVLIDQTVRSDFKPFDKVMVKVSGRKMDSSYEVFMSLYQQQIGPEGEDDTYKQFAPEFFDVVIVDECHRGSAREDSNWRKILEYFSGAVQIGMTATPKETKEVSNIDYFGDPLYIYSLKQGIEDGFLAPYRVLRVHLDKDLDGWRPNQGQRDLSGKEIPDQMYNSRDFDRTVVLDARTIKVADRITRYLKDTDRFDKTIVFCEDIDHAERMRQALSNANADLVAENYKYVMRITGDNPEGKAQLEYFMDDDSKYPALVTTSELMTTGVNCKTCKLIVIDKNINSMTEFKQIIGRGTRLYPKYGKEYFTIMDFRDASRLFADPTFDGEPFSITEGDHTPKITKTYPPGPPRDKYRVNNVDVQIVSEQVQYYGADGRLTTESFTDFTRKTVQSKFATLDAFLKTWTAHDKRVVISEELELEGVFLEKLREKAGHPEMDDFDLICHVAFDAKPLTKGERVKNVQKKGVLNKYSGSARRVLDILLEKYMSEGDVDIGDLRVLSLAEFMPLGTPPQIARMFGGRDKFVSALFELKSELYAAEG
ncbi:MAG: DEAD/DEAH box helicase family protein [Methanocorpusculum sp.]|nr:DEAD/DEAH box helicase family protein [Methanocorpusculum sp.]